jgi:hypothetical protein
MMNQSAQGLASLGRNGDSMLVHMSPDEFQGLQGLAMAQGGSLTINPDTGLPEAFKLKNVFKAALPIAAGFMFPGFGTSFMGGMLGKGIAAGALTGAGIAALSGENPFLGALTGGFGGYGGAGLAGSAGKVGALKGAEAGVGAGARTTAEANFANIQNISPFTPSGVAGTQAVSPALTSSAAGTAVPGSLGYDPTLIIDELATSPSSAAYLNASPASPFVSQTPGLSTQTLGIKEIPSGLGSATSGGGGYAGELGNSLQTAGENFGTLMKNPLDVMGDYGYGSSAMLAGGPLLAGVEPSDLGYGPAPLYDDPDKGKYKGPQGQLNLSDRFDTGLRLVAKGGYIDGYAMGGTVQSGGIRDLYGTPDNPPAMSSGLGGFGLGRLNNLAGEQARSQAQILGYADGGNVGADAVDESAPNPEGVVSKYTTVIDDKGVSSRVRVPYQYEKIITKGAEDFYDISPIQYAANLYPGSVLPKFKKEQMAKGGYLNGQGDGMSDSIPATIEGKQPARLADGEFVVPADVVSHLGNGSSKAGSKRLYAMLDKVRHARTGNKKQGKQINPAKYMPA